MQATQVRPDRDQQLAGACRVSIGDHAADFSDLDAGHAAVSRGSAGGIERWNDVAKAAGAVWDPGGDTAESGGVAAAERRHTHDARARELLFAEGAGRDD